MDSTTQTKVSTLNKQLDKTTISQHFTQQLPDIISEAVTANK